MSTDSEQIPNTPMISAILSSTYAPCVWTSEFPCLEAWQQIGYAGVAGLRKIIIINNNA